MHNDLQKIAVVIPCFNEEAGIASVIRGFDRHDLRRNGYLLDIIVVDNNSSDNTATVAHSAGARVISEPLKGKGNALRTGFSGITDDTAYVVMLDGDDTYNPKEIIRMIEPLRNNFCDVIIGSRLGGKMHDNSMHTFNRFGNWLYTMLVRQFYRASVTDVLTGYFAWKKAVIEELAPHLQSPGFAIEMEMITKMARLGYEIYSVPISYHPRSGESNLHPIRDGYRILKMFIKNLRWDPETPISTDMIASEPEIASEL